MGVGEGVSVTGIVDGTRACVTGVRCETEGRDGDATIGSTKCRTEDDCDKI